MTASELFASHVERVRRHDPDAWEALYKRLYPGLFAYAARRLGAQLAGDAVAEAMARAVAGIGKFEWRGGGLDAWIYGILRNVVADAQRSHARGRRADDCPPRLRVPTRSSTSSTPKRPRECVTPLPSFPLRTAKSSSSE